MADLLRTRFSEAPWLKNLDENYLTVGGSGGIGSWLTLYLSRIGFKNIEIYDFDTIEEHNLGGQWFQSKNKGVSKVIATKSNVYDFSEIDITAMHERVTENTAVGNIVFSAFDNMKARKDLFTAWKKANKDNPDAIFIDGRLAAEQFEIYCIKNTPEDIAFYESPEVLFDDDKIEETICSMKQTSHFSGMIGSFMTSFLTNHLTNVAEKEEIRVVPRETRYTGQLNMFRSS